MRNGGHTPIAVLDVKAAVSDRFGPNYLTLFVRCFLKPMLPFKDWIGNRPILNRRYDCPE